MASGVGYYYGRDESNDAVLSGLLDDGYDYPDAYAEAFAFEPRSVIASALPTTLESMHRTWTPFGGLTAEDYIAMYG